MNKIKSNKRVSIIIPNYNGKKLLERNLPSVIQAVRFSNQSHEIIVIDDNSTDGSVEFLRKNFSQVRTISLPRNFGFAQVCNLAAKISQYDLILFLNNDVQVAKDFLNPLINCFDLKDVFGVTPKIILPQENINESVHETVFAAGYFCQKRLDPSLLDKISFPYPVSFATGAALLVDKNKFFQLKGFDDIYHPFYWEDVDICYRSWKAGWQVIYQPKSLVYHYRGSTIGDGSKDPRIDTIHLRNMILFVWKNIDDLLVLTRHLIILPWDIILAFIGKRKEYLQAMKLALKKLPEIMRHRKKEKKKPVFTDSELLSFFQESIQVLKTGKFIPKPKAKALKIPSYKTSDTVAGLRPPKSLLTETPSDILVIHAEGGMGDIILSMPVIATLKKNFPQANLVMMVQEKFKEVISGNPNLNEIITVQPSELKSIKGFRDVLKGIKTRHFDLAIVLWSTFQLAWLAWLAEIKNRVGQKSRILYSFLYNWPVKVSTESGDRSSHWVEVLLDYVRVLGITDLERKLYFHVPLEADKFIENRLDNLGVLPEEKLIVLHIGKGIPLSLESWPIIKFAKIADELVKNFKIRVVLTGSKEEKILADGVCSYMKYKALNLAGELNLKQLGALIRRCEVFVCPDSGPMHIAAALGVPTAAIFALKSDFPNRWRPYGTRYEIIRNLYIKCPLKCVKEKCKRFVCVEQIKEEDVVKAVRRLLKPEFGL